MLCKDTIATKSGVFTFYDELVTKKEAKLKCKEKGEVLAPVFTQRDKQKIIDLFESNQGIYNCVFRTTSGGVYWVGLDIKFDNNTNKEKKVFSNGAKWKEHRHRKIYKDFRTKYTPCPITFFDPLVVEEVTPFAIDGQHMKWCGKTKHRYFCFKAKTGSSSKLTVEDKEISISELSVPLGILAAAAVLVIGVLAGLHLRKRKQKASF